MKHTAGTADVVAAVGRRARRRRRLGRLSSVLWPVATLALGLLGWELWIRVGDVPTYVMAPFSDALDGAISNRHILFPELWVTFREALYGFLASIAIAIPAAVAIDASWRIEQILSPFIITSQVVPVIALAPAMILWFGFGLLPKIMTVVLFATFVIVIESTAGLRSLETEKILLARSMGASRLGFLFRVKIPHALPSMFAGIKLAAMFSVTGAVVSEFIVANRGLGHYILYANSNLDTVGLVSGVLYLIAMGLLFFFAVDIAERLLLPWHVSRRLERVGGTL